MKVGDFQIARLTPIWVAIGAFQLIAEGAVPGKVSRGARQSETWFKVNGT